MGLSRVTVVLEAMVEMVEMRRQQEPTLLQVEAEEVPVQEVQEEFLFLYMVQSPVRELSLQTVVQLELLGQAAPSPVQVQQTVLLGLLVLPELQVLSLRYLSVDIYSKI